MARRVSRTHEYRCVRCGLRFGGRELPDGRVIATNGLVPEEPPRDALCVACAESGERAGKALMVYAGGKLHRVGEG